MRLLLVDLGRGSGLGPAVMQDEAFLCLKIMPHLPTQPKRQAVGTETHQGALLWEQELARQPVLSQPSLPVTHPVFEDVDFFFFPPSRAQR